MKEYARIADVKTYILQSRLGWLAWATWLSLQQASFLFGVHFHIEPLSTILGLVALGVMAAYFFLRNLINRTLKREGIQAWAKALAKSSRTARIWKTAAILGGCGCLAFYTTETFDIDRELTKMLAFASPLVLVWACLAVEWLTPYGLEPAPAAHPAE